MNNGHYNMDDRWYFDRFVKERRNSSALATELRLSCTNPSIYYLVCILSTNYNFLTFAKL